MSRWVASGGDASSAAQRSSLSLEDIETVPRWAVSSEAALVSGTMRLTYFTPLTSGTVTAVGTGVRGTAAGATPTLCRIGLYSVDADGNITLLTATANNTALWNSTFSMFFRSFTASQSLVVGRRYAVGILVVTAAAPPALISAGSNMFGEVTARTPRLAGAVTSLSDLPASVTSASVVNSSQIYYATFNRS